MNLVFGVRPFGRFFPFASFFPLNLASASVFLLKLLGFLMAVSMGMASGSWIRTTNLNSSRRNHKRVCCSSASLTDQYRTLRVAPGASENDVKKAFRQLALQYHPDVCKGSNCGVQFHRINEAYDVVMSNFRESNADNLYVYNGPSDEGDDESMRGVNDPSWDLWEEWMGWEGAGIRDYSSHINPYI